MPGWFGGMGRPRHCPLQFEDVRVLGTQLTQGLCQVEQVIAVAAAGPLAAIDVVGDIGDARRTEPRRVVMSGKIDQAIHMVTGVAQPDRDSAPLIPVLLAMVEMREHLMLDPVGHAQADLIG